MTELVVVISGKMIRPPLLALENQIVDLAFQVRAENGLHNKLKTEDIVIIDVDDASIEKLGRNQLWPRSYDARVISYIASGKPKAIGMDFLYTERDTLSFVYAEMLREKGFSNAPQIINSLSSDSIFTRALSDAGNVYLSCYDDDKKIYDAFNITQQSLLKTISSKSGYLAGFPRLNCPTIPVEDFSKAAKAVGTIAMPTMLDGTVRHYSALQQMPNSDSWQYFLGNFPLYMYLDARSIDHNEIQLTSEGIMTMEKDSLLIPLSETGTFRVNWLGQTDSIRYISYYKILDEYVPAEFFENKYVFFGTSAKGLEDLKTVPPSNEKMPGVEVHAIAFLNMMNSAFIHEVSEAKALPYFLLISFLLVSLFLLLKPLWGIIVSIAFIFFELIAFVYWVLPVKTTVFPIVTLMLLTFLSYLTASLYIYFIRERRNRILKSAFGSYVSPEVVEQISKNSNVLQLGGERKELTVLFSDIRGFTAYSEGMDPQEIVSVLNDYLSRMSEVIFKYKGTIDKFIGDAVMAIFGAPVPQKDHASKACHVALDMMKELRAINETRSNSGQGNLSIGIGINTGEMTVGNIGSRKRFDYTVIGDEVNLGSRLEGLSKFFGVTIIVASTTKDACSDNSLLFRTLGKVKVKGKEKSVLVYQLLETVEDIQMIDKWLLQWNEAMSLWENNNRSAAKEAFVKCLQYQLDDAPTHYYISRCDEKVTDESELTPVIIMENK